MIPCKPKAQKLTIFTLIFAVFATFSVSAQDGKALFMANCASCHNVFKDGTGPKLGGAINNEYFGGDNSKMHNWVHNPGKLINDEPYFAALKAKFGSVMTPFPGLKNEEIDAIIGYVEETFAKGPGGGKTRSEERRVGK